MKSIGRHGSPWTPDTARNEARRLLGLVAGGTDPARQRSGETFGVIVERYLAHREASMKPRSFAETVRHLRVRDAKPLHSFALADIDRRAIAERLDRIEADSGPVARNKARSSISAFFAWAIAAGLTETNPVTGTRKADAGGSRTRVLSDAELATVWRSLGNDAYGDIVRLLILTGQRREEIGALRWSEIVSAAGGEGAALRDVDGDACAIVLPPERTKNSQEHIVPLSRQAREIIDRQPPRRGAFVFGGQNRFRSWSHSKATLDARIGEAMPAFRVHDLRRTVATRMGDRLGVLPHVVEAILNHISGHKAGVAGVYNLARYEGEMREALTRWADYVESLVSASSAALPAASAAQRPKSLRLVRVMAAQ